MRKTGKAFCCLFLVLAMPFAVFDYGLAAEKAKAIKAVDFQALKSNLNGREVARLLIQEIENRKYKEVNQYFDYLVDKKPMTRNGWRLVEDVYEAIRNRRVGLDVLDQWCATTDHPSAFICRGGEYLERGSKARGDDLGYTVSGTGAKDWTKYASLAKADFEKAYSLRVTDPNSAARMILASFALKEEDVEVWFQRATKADPVSIYAYLNKGIRIAPKWGGDPKQYQNFIEACHKSTPTGTVAYIVALECYYDLASLSGNKKSFLNHPEVKLLMEEVLQRWLRDYPDSTAARVWQARISRDRGKADEAVKYCTDVLQMDSSNVPALNIRAAAYFYDIDSGVKALEDYRRIVEIEPLNDWALYHIGKVAFFNNNDRPGAIEYYRQAIEVNKSNKFYFYHRGLAYSYSQQYSEASEDFTKAISIDPKFVAAYIGRGQVKTFQNDCKHAVADYDTALAINPREGEAYYYRGNCYQSMKQFQKAEDDYLKAKRYAPGYAQAVERSLKEMKEIEN